jgi:predicted nucleic-acid-binding protein
MIGLDTNVMVRYLVQDEPRQSSRVNHLIEKATGAGVAFIVSQTTLCEIVWVLKNCYDCSKEDLITMIRQLLRTQQIRIENSSVVGEALLDFEHHDGVDFSDCLIGRQNGANNCSFTYTFDKNAAKKLHRTFKLITE